MQFSFQRQQVVECGRQMARAALAVGTWGNISRRLAGGLIAITPSGMEYEIVEPQDIVIMDLDGNCIEGECKPSTEEPLHRAIYAARADVGAIVHTHSIYASAMAAARKPIPGVMEDLAQIVGGDVRVAKYALPGSSQLGSNAVEALAGRNGALLANHGVVGVGDCLKQALLICQIIEKSAQIFIAALAVGGAVELPQEDIDFMRDFFLHKYGQR